VKSDSRLWWRIVLADDVDGGLALLQRGVLSKSGDVKIGCVFVWFSIVHPA
jgi:hypothetical protein